MSKRGIRLIASAILTVGGGMTMRLAEIARVLGHQESEVRVFGAVLLLAGTVMFLIDYIKSWKDDARSKPADAERREEKPEPPA